MRNSTSNSITAALGHGSLSTAARGSQACPYDTLGVRLDRHLTDHSPVTICPLHIYAIADSEINVGTGILHQATNSLLSISISDLSIR